MRSITRTLSPILGCLVLAAGPALAQPAQPAGPAPEVVEEPLVELSPAESLATIDWQPPAWTSDEIARVGDMLEGTWRTTGSVGPIDGSEPTPMVMHVTRVKLKDLTDTMYVEVAQTTVPEEATWQAIWQLYEYEGHIRLRMIKPQTLQWGFEAFSGFWAIPDQFPELASTDLLAIMDIDLSATSDGYTGTSPYPYPTLYGGAVEVTSSIEIAPDHLTTTDRGTDAQGRLAWGPDTGASWDWQRAESDVLVRRPTSGVIVVNYPTPREQEPKDGDFLQWSYIGWTLSDGRRFATSELAGRPMGFPAPIGPTTINRAWYEGCRDTYLGAVRKFVIPPALAYGAKGDINRYILPNERIVVLAKCVNIASPSQTNPATPTDQPADDSE